MHRLANSPDPHPPRWVVWALAGGGAVSVGFSRFGYGLILPSMQQSFGWTYAQAGLLNTFNAVGYLGGALLAALLINRLGNRLLLGIGLVVTELSLLMSGAAHTLEVLSVLRFTAGMGAAWIFIAGGVLASTLGTRAIAVFFSGAGAGMIMTGATLPWIFQRHGNAAWPCAWVVVAVMCLPMCAAGFAALRHLREPQARSASAPWQASRLRLSMAAYTLFGVGYIPYMTFIVAWLRENPTGLGFAATSSAVWCILGAATLVAPRLWGKVLARDSVGSTLALALYANALGVTLALLVPGMAGVAISAFVFGCSLFTVPSAMGTLVKSQAPSQAWGKTMSTFTIAFAAGQVVGPIVAGWIGDVAHSLTVGLAASAGTLGVAGVLASVQHRRLLRCAL